MKKKILGILSLVLCLGMLLTSCSKGGKAFNEVVVDPYEEKAPILTSVTDFKVFSGEDVDMEMVDSFGGRFVVFQNNDVIVNDKVGEAYIAVVDVKESKVIKSWNWVDKYNEEQHEPLSYTDIANIGGEAIYDALYNEDDEVIAFYVGYVHYDAENYDTEYSYTLYNLDGSEVNSEDVDYMYSGWTLNYNVKRDNLFVNDEQYKIGATLTIVGSYNKFTKFPSIDEEGEKYLYDEVNGSIIIYDFNYNKVGVYTYPATHMMDWCVLQNGDILFNGTNMLPFDADDYDYYYPSGSFAQKFENKVEIYSVAEGKAEKLDLGDYVIDDVISIEKDSEYDIYGSNYANILYLAEIQDKVVSDKIKVMAMDSEGKLSEMPELVPNQDVVRASGIQGRYVAVDMNGNAFYVDANGKVLGDWNKINNYATNRNESYFVSDSKIYDWDLNVVAEISEDYNLVGILAHGYVFATSSEDVVAEGEQQTYTMKTIIFKDGAFTDLTSYKAIDSNSGLPAEGETVAAADVISDQLYMVMSMKWTAGVPEDVKVVIYNEAGTQLKEITDIDVTGSEPIRFAVAAEDGSYAAVYAPDGTIYKFAK